MADDIKKENGYRKIIIISNDYRMLYASSHAVKDGNTDILGKKCYKALFDRDTPCDYCLADQVIKTQKPALMRRNITSKAKDSEKGSCVYTYPILSGDRTDALLMLDIDLPAMEKMTWKCSKCGYTYQTEAGAAPHKVCPACKETCEFLNVTCYVPECGFSGQDPRLG